MTKTGTGTLILVGLVILIGLGAFFALRNDDDGTQVNNPPGTIATTTPRGTSTTTTPIQNSMIRVTSPLPNSLVKSPITVTGEARGGWYFEASFPVKIYDANGKLLGQAPAQAQGEWMTNNFVPFKATFNFATSTTATGVIVFEKDNPSGLPENDAQVRVPVRFENVVSKTPIQDAVNTLLAQWKLPGVSLVGAALNGSVLTLEFSDPQNQTSGGSARVTSFRTQIMDAVKKYGVTSINYRPVGVFEP